MTRFAEQIYFVSKLVIKPSHFDAGLNSSTFGHLQVGASRPGRLNVIRTNQIDANSITAMVEKVQAARVSFAATFAPAFATVNA